MEEKKKAAYRQNIYVVVAIGVLTLVEFWFALNLANPTVPVFIVALLKAGLIVQYFMHIYRLWREEDHS